MNQELPYVQAEFRKYRGTRDQIANICCIIEKVKEFQKKICIIDCAKSRCLFASGIQSTGASASASASVLPMNIQG